MTKRNDTPDASAARYRRLALALRDAAESSHMGAPDFRLGGKIFATLAYQAKGLGTLKLTPEQQAGFLADAPKYFEPAPGAWGRKGMTLIRLDAPEDVLAGALLTAYRNVLKSAAGTSAAQASGHGRSARAYNKRG